MADIMRKNYVKLKNNLRVLLSHKNQLTFAKLKVI